jgi:hypothetical protein
MKLDEMYEDTNIINHVLDLKEKGNHKLDDKACGGAAVTRPRSTFFITQLMYLCF